MPNQFRHMLRSFAHTPLFTLMTILTLAIGIGANTAIFSVINGILLKPLPYPEPDRLVGLWHTAPGIGIKELNASPATYFTYREEGRVFTDSGVWRTDTANVTGVAEPEQVDVLVVTDGVLPLLGVQPQLGRLFTRKDDTAGNSETILLTHGYWQQRFGGDPGVVGRALHVDGKPMEIIGVLPARFRFLDEQPQIVMPYQFDRGKVFVGNFSHTGIARLKPGVTIAQANADLARMLPMLLEKFPPAPGMSRKMLDQARVAPDVRLLKSDLIGDVGKTLWVLMATIGIVLLIACANVANLLLVRTDARQQELAVRAALGAGWGALARQLWVESILLAAAGGVVGLGLAWSGLRVLAAARPRGLPRLDEIHIDPLVVGFALVVSLLAGVLFGLIPVLKYAGPRIYEVLRGGGRSLSGSRERHRVRNGLVIVQVALALVLLIGSGLMIRTFYAMRAVEPGFSEPEQILTLRVFIPEAQVKDGLGVLRQQQEMLRRIQQISGVQSAAITNSATMDGNRSGDPLFAQDRAYSEGEIPPIRRYKWVGPGYFSTMGRRLLAGRDLNWDDTDNTRAVVMVSANLAKELWGSPQAAIGKRVRENPKGVWREVVGVTADERDNGVDRPAPACVYWPLLLRDFWGEPLRVRRDVAFVIRSPRAGTEALVGEVRQAIWSVNKDVPIADIRTMEKILARSMARTSFTLVMLAIAASMALLLGVVGLYGVISYTVSQRTREIGIRMALGAQQGDVRTLFLRQGLVLALIGVACGLAAASALSRLIQSLLFEVSPYDPLTFVSVPLLLAGAAAAASYLPARRATVIQPVDALRAE